MRNKTEFTTGEHLMYGSFWLAVFVIGGPVALVAIAFVAKLAILWTVFLAELVML